MADIVARLMNGCVCFTDPPAVGMTHEVDDVATDTLMEQGAGEIERLRYVLNGVRGAIMTGRNEPLQIWREQIDIALNNKEPSSE